MNTSVKHISSFMRGAPTLNGVAASLIAVLDAFFITGWGGTTAVSVSVSGGVATAILNPGETFVLESVVLVSGATPNQLNGESRVSVSTNTSISWPTTAADGPATGVISIKYAPQTGFEKVFGASGKAVYRSTNVLGSRMFYRLDDTGTTSARLRGYEDMSDVDTGVGPFPTDVQATGGLYVFKSSSASTTGVRYRIFADDRAVIFCIATHSVSGTAVASPARGFGDPLPLSPTGDYWGAFVTGSGSSSSNFYNGSLGSSIASSTSGGTYSPRSISGLGSSVILDIRTFIGSPAALSGADDYLGQAPSSVDGQIKISRTFFKEVGSSSPPRSVVPGAMYIPQSGAYNVLQDGDILDGSGELSGRRLLALGNGTATATPSGVYLVDMTGPWR